jgi:ribosomal protein S18 acetylase RimI-like enzyme
MDSIELGVQQNNQSALDFYTKLGFVKFDQIRYASTNLMRLELKNQKDQDHQLNYI